VAHRLELTPRALRDLKKLPAQARERLQPTIEALASDPRPAGVVKLEGEQDVYRVRVGDYRILYEVHDSVLLVIVVKVGNRRDVYR
jgi:mRNA interferase RelE/StbE